MNYLISANRRKYNADSFVEEERLIEACFAIIIEFLIDRYDEERSVHLN